MIYSNTNKVFRFIINGYNLVQQRYFCFADTIFRYIQTVNAGHVPSSIGLIFPTSNTAGAENWLSGNLCDPNGAFVQSRKCALDFFYQKLFNQNPSLYEDKKTIEFLQVNISTFQ
jgi:hypothetical protein